MNDMMFMCLLVFLCFFFFCVFFFLRILLEKHTERVYTMSETCKGIPWKVGSLGKAAVN